MFKNRKNQILFGILSFWSLSLIILSIIKIMLIKDENENVSNLKNWLQIFQVIETIFLWAIIAAISWSLIKKTDRLSEHVTFFLLATQSIFIVLLLIKLVIDKNHIFSIAVQVTLVLVVLAITLKLLHKNKFSDHLLKNIIVIGLKIAWAVISLIDVIMPPSIVLQTLTLTITLIMTFTSVTFIGIKNKTIYQEHIAKQTSVIEIIE